MDRRTICGKFGGSTFDGAGGFMQAAEYLDRQAGQGYSPVAVVSAPKGVSNMLIEALKPNDGIADLQWGLHEKYRVIVEGMLSGRARWCAWYQIELGIEKMPEMLKKNGNDCFLALGEDHSGLLLGFALEARGKKPRYISGFNAGITVSEKGRVLEEESVGNLSAAIRKCLDDGCVPIVGGYVGRHIGNNGPVHRLMGRNTSDVTGAIASCAAGAKAYEIIKDVPGVYRVEPEFCSTGIAPKLSYDEAGQITWRGAKVVHPHAITIARRHGMPIRVRSMESDSFTLISDASDTTPEHPVAAISAGRFYMLNVSDDVMNTPEGKGYLALLASVFTEMGMDIFDAAMPANTISLVIPASEHTENGIEGLIKSRLEKEGYSPDISGREVGGISVTGEAMKGNPGTLSHLAGIFGKRSISIAMGSQSDEAVLSPTINFYVEPARLGEAVSALCSELFAEDLSQCPE